LSLLDAITIDASTTLRLLLERTASESEKMYVVIRRAEGAETYWYTWTVEDLRLAADGASEARLDLSLTEALDLHEYQSVDHYESGTAENLSERHGVLLRGNDAIGVLRPETVMRGGLEGMRRSAARESGGSAAAAGREAERTPFSAYPALTAPEQLASKQEFDLEIGLSATPVAGVAGGPITGVVPPAFKFDLQVVADGFEFPNGSAASLEVDRDNFEAAATTVKLIAPAVANGASSRGTLEVLFYYEGNLCGQALRTIAVGEGVPPAPPVTEDSAASISIPDVPAPDLTVKISRGAADSRLMWTFSTRPGLPAGPAQSVATELDGRSAKSFALERIRSLADWDKNPLTTAKLVGIGEEISRTMPNEFWLTLDAIWEHKQDAGEPVPSLLFVSEDPYVPWELAATTDRYARPQRIDSSRPLFLGTQLRVGRWIPPVSTPFGGDIPTLPPPTTAEIGEMVVFAGDYSAINGQRPLPLALEEGEKLALRYHALKRSAVTADVNDLLNDAVSAEGQQVKVDAIHFACHGEVSTDPKHNGIVLSDQNVRFGADMVSGSAIGKTSNPFVFLNACQLGLETEGVDGNYGGLAGAFLDQGATAFVSPLWSVDDAVAQEVALDFYKQAFDTNKPVAVADVLSELRSRFATSPQASYLAYVYYGHPDLMMTKTKGETNGVT
jgi:hypothetical protein